jgi:hypothetical protein
MHNMTDKPWASIWVHQLWLSHSQVLVVPVQID